MAFSEGLGVSDVPAIGSTWRARSYMTPIKPQRDVKLSKKLEKNLDPPIINIIIERVL